MEAVKLISYNDSGNLGDAIQTFCLQRFLDERGIDVSGYEPRGSINRYFADKLIVNGWHRGIENRNPHYLPKRAIFVGLHAGPEQIKCIDKDILVGCRDTYTYQVCKDLGQPAIITGCPTSTFQVRMIADARSTRKVVNIDYPHTYSAFSNLTQRIDSKMPWNVQIGHAVERLQTYIQCNKIFTSRLHVFLPCIAAGVNVELDFQSTKSPERFSVIDPSELDGTKYNKDITHQQALSVKLRERWINGFFEVFNAFKP